MSKHKERIVVLSKAVVVKIFEREKQGRNVFLIRERHFYASDHTFHKKKEKKKLIITLLIVGDYDAFVFKFVLNP